MKSVMFAVAVLALASGVQAALQVTHATVVHNKAGVVTVPLDSSSAGNSFNTYDGKTGASLTLGETTGVLRVDTSSNFGIPFSTYNTTSGSISFVSLGGTFSATPDFTHAGFGTSGFAFKITNLSTNDYRNYHYLYGPNDEGTMTFPAPAGSYELTFASGQYSVSQSSPPGYGLLNFSITPEPATASICLSMAMFRRRRRA